MGRAIAEQRDGVTASSLSLRVSQERRSVVEKDHRGSLVYAGAMMCGFCAVHTPWSAARALGNIPGRVARSR